MIILSALVLGISLIAILIQVQTKQNLRQKASEINGVSMQLFSTEDRVNVGEDLVMPLLLNNPEQKKISAIDFTINYDSGLFEFLNISPSSELGLFTGIPVKSNLGTYRYMGVNMSENLPSASYINLGTIRFRIKKIGTSTFNFPTIHVNASGIRDALPVDIANTKGVTITIVDSVTTTTTIMPSASTPTPVPTSTPNVTTPTPNPISTTTPTPIFLAPTDTLAPTPTFSSADLTCLNACSDGTSLDQCKLNCGIQ